MEISNNSNTNNLKNANSQELAFIWQEVTNRCKEVVWLNTCVPIELKDGVLVLEVPNVFIKERIQSRFADKISDVLRQMGAAQMIDFKIISDATPTEQHRASEAAKAQPERPNIAHTGLNPNYVFDSFVVGNSNRLAHAASLAAAADPGIAYNPLFIWGGVGLGKTHLMHAIGHYVLDNKPKANIVYVSSEKFTNELISSIQNKRNEEFRSKYRNVDVLLVDDIQFLADKESTQEEFFHTFNTLHDARKQVVISSDRPPKEIKRVEERLVSRFEWGLVTDINAPDYETRVAILQKKAEMRGYNVPRDVIEFLAQNIPSNIRELEGSLNRVVAFAELYGEIISIERVSVWLKDTLRNSSRGPVNIDLIQQLVAQACGIPPEDLSSAKRTSDLALARQMAMYLAREHTDMSLQQIGYFFNKKDHTTVIHAQRKIEELLLTDAKVKTIVDNVRTKL